MAARSRLIAELAPVVAEAEIFPLAVLAEGSGALALDCLIVAQPGSPTA